MATPSQVPDLPVFDNSYQRLPERFYARQAPQPVGNPALVCLNHQLAAELDFNPDSRSAGTWAGFFSGNELLPGTAPIALAYAGHQFGHFVPQLGDGRALLLGEIIDRRGERYDLQLKGSGPTPFSRQGDGRAALGPVLREFIVSEAMHALGVPSTRSLAAVTTGEEVYRETALPGAVLARVADSHVRVGTFQYFLARGDQDAVRELADYVIDRHYPEDRDTAAPYLELLRQVTARHAQLVAKWLGVGFIHGVMNTDNVSIAGETIDYGPCAFMDESDPATVYSSIDQHGRYAYGRQPQIAQWNMARLAETLLPLLAQVEEEALALATEVVNEFNTVFEDCWRQEMGRKLGLSASHAGDDALIAGLLDMMNRQRADHTLTFRRLADVIDDGFSPLTLEPLLGSSAEIGQWLSTWRTRLADEEQGSAEIAAGMRSVNPIYVPRNHLVQQMIDAAVEGGDFAPFERLGEVLAAPYDEHQDNEAFALPPEPHERVTETFCGT